MNIMIRIEPEEKKIIILDNQGSFLCELSFTDMYHLMATICNLPKENKSCIKLGWKPTKKDDSLDTPIE